MEWTQNSNERSRSRNATGVYSCTLFKTVHILVNYEHNYVSHVSLQIITRSVLLPEHIRLMLI